MLAGMASLGLAIACTDSRVLAVLGFPLASWWGCPLQAVGRLDLAGTTLGLWPLVLLLLECLAEPVFDRATTVMPELTNL